MIVHKSQTRSVASASAVTGLGALMPRLNMFGTVWRRGGWTVHGSKLCLLFRYSPWGSDDSLGSRTTVNWDLSPPPPTPLSAALTPGLSTPSSMPVNDLLHLLVPARTTPQPPRRLPNLLVPAQLSLSHLQISRTGLPRPFFFQDVQLSAQSILRCKLLVCEKFFRLRLSFCCCHGTNIARLYELQWSVTCLSLSLSLSLSLLRCLLPPLGSKILKSLHFDVEIVQRGEANHSRFLCSLSNPEVIGR